MNADRLGIVAIVLGIVGPLMAALLWATAGTIDIVSLLVGACVMVLAPLIGVVVGGLARVRGRAKGESTRFATAGTIVSAIALVPVAGLATVFGMLFAAGGHGRPLRIAGRATVGRAKRRAASWGRPLAPRLEGIDEATRAKLADAWLSDARLEHAAIAAFSRLTCDLLAVGAPPDLVEASSRAAADESRHAQACFALASAYAGAPLGPDAMPEARVLELPSPRRTLLRKLLRESIVDGTVGEGAAARTARECAKTASDPVVRGVLEAIAEEEAAHAALGDAIVRWVCGELGPGSEEVIASALAEAARLPAGTGSSLDLAAHGRPSQAVLEAARAGSLADVREWAHVLRAA